MTKTETVGSHQNVRQLFENALVSHPVIGLCCIIPGGLYEFKHHNGRVEVVCIEPHMHFTPKEANLSVTLKPYTEFPVRLHVMASELTLAESSITHNIDQY